MSYSDIVKEAFINPLRSVLIVDDEYPTWERLFKTPTDGSGDEWNGNKDEVYRTISEFREHSPSFIIDMDDGGSLDLARSEEIAGHLHQSDLLVLDYRLEGSMEGGEKCISLVRNVLKNEHFNLVIVQTSDPDVAFENIVISLLPKEKEIPGVMIKGGEKSIDVYVLTLVEDKGDLDEIKDKKEKTIEDLMKNFGDREFVYCFLNSDMAIFNFKVFSDMHGPLINFMKILKSKFDEKSIINVCAFILKHKQNSLKDRLSTYCHNSLKWSDKRDNEKVSWIRTSKGFLAFAEKKSNVILLDVLKSALKEWRPTPTRLISAKLRAEIDKQGVIAEDKIFANTLVFRKFYESLISLDEDDKDIALKNHINRYIESLGDESSKSLIKFGKKITEVDPFKKNEPDGFIHYYGTVTPTTLLEATSRYNSYVCSKSVTGRHINIGHIFSINDDAGKQYWVCLSPACDMVPEQRKVGHDSGDGETKSFLAVRLHNGFSDLSSEEINSNEYVFLKIGEKIEIKSIYAKQSNAAKDYGKEPIWRIFFAKNYGRFDAISPEHKLEIQWLKSEASELNVKKESITVKWQLRYEYALNLNQKLGGNLTRVGLEFLS